MGGEAQRRLFDPPAARKARGAFFTPPALCAFVAEWAITSPEDTVFEPSCGEAAFLLAAADRLRALGAAGALDRLLNGVEVHGPSAVTARRLLAEVGAASSIREGDFFTFEDSRRFDAVIGNPPYVRYQDHTGAERARSQAAALAQGVRLSGLASSWAAFTVHSALSVAPGGRMGLVLPGELLSVSYAAEVREFLLRRFGRVRLVLFEERVFPEVLEEVVLLLAEGEGGTDHFEVYQARDTSDLANLGEKFRVWRPAEAAGKWLSALLDPAAVAILSTAQADGRLEALNEWGKTSLGIVSGNNRYFAVSQQVVDEHKIGSADLVRLSAPGSKHLRGLEFTHDDWEVMRADGSPVYLFYPSPHPSKGAKAYIALGEAEDVHTAYKCRVRHPWYRVPFQNAPDLIMTYMSHYAPRLISNAAEVTILNSVFGLRLKERRKTSGAKVLPIAALNSASLLGAEIVGRSYGGGLLKLEPREADLWPVPSAALTRASGRALQRARPQIEQLLEGGEWLDAVDLVDRIVLIQNGGIKPSEVAILKRARQELFDRRAARGGKRRAS